MHRSLLPVVLLALQAACSVLTDVDSLGGRRSDAGAVDAPAVLDAGNDTGSRTDALAAPFCASLSPAPKLCADFDVGGFSAEFSKVILAGTGKLGQSVDAFRSSPHSLLARVEASDAGTHVANMARFFIGTASTSSLSFDFRPEAWVAGKSGVAGAIVLNDGTLAEHVLSFYVTDTYAALEEIFDRMGTTQFVDHTLTLRPMLGAWTRVSLVLDAAKRSASVTLDGKPALTDAPLDASWAPGTPSVVLGIMYTSGNAGPWAFRYDDVVFDWK